MNAKLDAVLSSSEMLLFGERGQATSCDRMTECTRSVSD
jgi:hypothetical protein